MAVLPIMLAMYKCIHPVIFFLICKVTVGCHRRELVCCRNNALFTVLWLCPHAEVFAYREAIEKGFQPMQMCSPSVLQNPKCTLLNVDATVHLLKVYDLTGKRPTV